MTLQFLTAPFSEQHIQGSVLKNLFGMYHEVRAYFDNEEDSAAIVITDTDDEDS